MGDHVFLKVMPKRGVIRFDKQGKLAPRYIYLFLFIFISFFASFSDLRKSDCRFSSRLKAKLIHIVRATCGYQNLKVSSNSTR